jgi:hypothetical protein
MSKEILDKFDTDGRRASYHYACDYGGEWRHGTSLEAGCRRLFKENPELQDEMRKLASQFLWSL